MNKETKGNNLLLPLALGGGLLLLFMSMKSKAQDNPNLLPPKEIEPEADQIIPDEAPKYTSLPSPASSEEDYSEDAEQSPAPPANKYTPPAYTPSAEEESEDYADASRTGNDADSSEDWEDEDEAANSTNNSNPITQSSQNSKLVKLDKMRPLAVQNKKFAERVAVAPQGIRAQSDQNRKFTERGAVLPQSIRSQSDQNRKFAERGGIVQNAKVNKLNSMRSFSDQAKLLAQQKAKNAPIQAPIPLPAQPNTGSKIFPLKQGQTNNYIKEVQRKLGVSATGFFGTQTRAALLKKYKVTEISEALYKQIISGKAIITKAVIPIKKMTKPLLKAKPKVKKKITKVVPKKTVKRK